MKDDWEKVTRLLLRAKDFVKDNRLPPKSFDTAHADYKYIKIIGAAADDDDFNAGGSGETDGNGADIVHYQIPIGSSDVPPLHGCHRGLLSDRDSGRGGPSDRL
jgi:hypothetical protein